MVRLMIALAVYTAVIVSSSTAAARTHAESQSAREIGAVLTLAELERIALENNPTLAQASAEIDAAKGRAKQAGLLPNPTVGYSGDEVSRGPVIRGGEHGIFAEQTIPLGGKLGLSRRVFEREATQAEALRDVQRQRILNDVRSLYYSALAAERRVEVRQSLVNLSAEAVGVSRQLYNTGAADQTDVLASEIEARETQLALERAQNDRFKQDRHHAARGTIVPVVPGAVPRNGRRVSAGARRAADAVSRQRAIRDVRRDGVDGIAPAPGPVG